MPSPFPGMDPYLENPVWWPDFHHSFITYARDALQPGLRPRYRARISVRCVTDAFRSERVYIVEPPQHYYPDIAILGEEERGQDGKMASSFLPPCPLAPLPFCLPHNVNGSNSQFAMEGVSQASHAMAEADNPVIIRKPASGVGELTLPKEAQKQGFIEILHADGAVVSVIEVLSPVNKTPPRGLNDYHEKQRQLLWKASCNASHAESATHLVEIDLLRRGTHAVAVPSELVAEQCATWDYLVCVHRASKIHRQVCYRFEVYPVTIRRRMPRIRVPLRAPDPDIVLDLQAVFVRCYDSGGYEDFVDYNAEPPVPLAPDDALFSDALLREVGRRTPS